MSETLKPCPFCKATPLNEIGIGLCCTPVNAEEWNHRPIEDELNKRIAELEIKLSGANAVLAIAQMQLDSLNSKIRDNSNLYRVTSNGNGIVFIPPAPEVKE